MVMDQISENLEKAFLNDSSRAGSLVGIGQGLCALLKAEKLSNFSPTPLFLLSCSRFQIV